MNSSEVILVDELDNPTGTADKLKAHLDGKLHRAFSIFIFNNEGKMLLQQRAMAKYHSGGLWSNACCSHPQPGEEIFQAAVRRLKEEIGFETTIYKIFDFVYKAEFENGLTEHEFDHVFAGEYEGEIDYSEEEVMDICFKSMSEIKDELKHNPMNYSVWFQIAFPKVEEWWSKQIKYKIA